MHVDTKVGRKVLTILHKITFKLPLPSSEVLKMLTAQIEKLKSLYFVI